MARPTRYDAKIHCEIVKSLAARGYTDKEMATILNISEKTFYLWQEKYPEFLQAIKEGKEKPNHQVERALFERATGYEHEAVKIFCGRDGIVTQVKYIEHYPPDPTSMIFFLKNRMPEKWRDVRQTELTGKDGKPVEIKNLTDQDLDAEIAKAEQQLANDKPGKGKRQQ